MPTDPRDEWFAWRGWMAKRANPLGDDPLANYEFGLRVGQRMAIERTASWAGLVPLLQDVLDHLIVIAVEKDAEVVEASRRFELETEPEPAA